MGNPAPPSSRHRVLLGGRFSAAGLGYSFHKHVLGLPLLQVPRVQWIQPAGRRYDDHVTGDTSKLEFRSLPKATAVQARTCPRPRAVQARSREPQRGLCSRSVRVPHQHVLPIARPASLSLILHPPAGQTTGPITLLLVGGRQKTAPRIPCAQGPISLVCPSDCVWGWGEAPRGSSFWLL